jgi:hypothetical protein
MHPTEFWWEYESRVESNPGSKTQPTQDDWEYVYSLLED